MSIKDHLHAALVMCALCVPASALSAQVVATPTSSPASRASPAPGISETSPDPGAPPGEALANLADLNFEVLGAKQGLPHDSVYGFAQDKRGFLWIATFGGLSRFDGYRLHNYIHNEQDTSSLPDNNTRLLLPTPDGGLWIATGNAGVIQYDAATDSFHPLPDLPAALHNSHVFCLADDGEGGLWFGSQLGLVHYQPTKPQHYEVFGKASGRAADSFGEGSVFSVFKDREGNLWVGGDHGLLVRRPGSAVFEVVTGLSGPGQLGEFPPVWTIAEDSAGRLWIGTDKSGAGILNPATGHIEGVPGLAGADSLIGTATVRGIVEVRKGVFWIATYGSGLVTFDWNAHRGRRYLRDLTASSPLSNNFIRSIFMDRSGIVWLGTDRGLSKINPSADGLLNIHSSPLRTAGLIGNEVRSVTAQGDRIWVGYDQGGFAVIEPDGRIHNIAPAPGVTDGEHSQREVLAIKAADQNTVYAGGVGVYEIDARKLTYKPVDNPMLAKHVVNALLVDGNDLWAATYDGLVRYDRATHKAQFYVHDVGNPGSLSDNYARDLLKSSDGRLWVTTRLGLDRFDPATGSFAHIRHNPQQPDSLPSNNIQPIAEDLRGQLWIGTIGDGLTILENWTPDGQPHFRTLNAHDGFPDGIVLTVMRGADGRMWSATPGGLAVIDPDTFKVHTYTAADGLRTSSQNLFSSATLRDGTIVFPGDQGLIVVRPGLLKRASFTPPLVATTVFVQGSSLSTAAQAWHSVRDGIILPPGHRAFQASFASLDYAAPDAVRYRYKLEGFEKDWVESASYTRTAAYTNLPAGNYVLVVEATDRLGAESSGHLEIPVHVPPAWYERHWFLALKIAAALGVLLLVVRLRTEVIRKRRDQLEREVESRTAELASKQKELMEANEKLAELATTDPLTGVFNRRQFLISADDEMERARRTRRPFTLLLIDADHFKAINDSYGHLAGDEVLKALVQQMTRQMRRNDVIARYGGEELVLLLPNTRLPEGLQFAERMRETIATFPIEYREAMITVTISVGATETDGREQLAEVLRKADEALYEAKTSGRNRVVAAGSGELRS
ncbi:MAG TPA: diguanylate cyclase [Acidobacteriaceae bacterium]|jgi:diguanylate cyclase (GGDEF)-like protein